LKLIDVQIHFKKIEILKKISLEIQGGEIVALLGANGAGKTSTLRTISGLIVPSAGSIQFEGQKINGANPRTIVKMGLAHCPEGRKVWPDMSVLENLEMGAYAWFQRKVVKSEIERIFDNFPILQERKNQLAGTLSGGEQQMLAIGRALMAKPKLLLLDEPSLGLSPLVVEKTFAVIKNIHRQGTTVFLVEQNLYLALKMAHRGYILETGRIVLAGDSKSLLSNSLVKKAYLGG